MAITGFEWDRATVTVTPTGCGAFTIEIGDTSEAWAEGDDEIVTGTVTLTGTNGDFAYPIQLTMKPVAMTEEEKIT